ncbi:hypothetical protein [Metabacillus litoralis]|jgi:carbonic anhydrase|nr:hypothetical protein [Metabacillus litoralis]MCM3653756.1 hypothetical protein [Metabacillus litoralis]
MELHVVYKSDKGNLAVVGVMIKVGKEKQSIIRYTGEHSENQWFHPQS